MAASSSHGPFSGMVQGSVNRSLKLSSRSRLKEKHLLSSEHCSMFYCRYALVRTDSKLINSYTHTLYWYWSRGAKRCMRKALINAVAVLRCRLVHITCTQSVPGTASIAACTTLITAFTQARSILTVMKRVKRQFTLMAK
jgi:hypothetical protein